EEGGGGSDSDHHGHDRGRSRQTRGSSPAWRGGGLQQELPARDSSNDHRPAGEQAMNEVIREFLIETHENLAQLDLDLVTLEKEPTERDTLSRVFRTLHTVKGSAGFLGLQRLQAVAHAAENLLSRLRAGELTFNAEIASALLAVVDAVRQMLQSVEASETDGDGDFSALIETLERLRAAAGARDEGRGARDEQLLEQSSPLVPSPSLAPAATILGSEHPVAEGGETRSFAVSDSSIRVDVGLLDKLMTLVGEMVLARNQIMQLSSSQEDTALLCTVQSLNLL